MTCLPVRGPDDVALSYPTRPFASHYQGNAHNPSPHPSPISVLGTYEPDWLWTQEPEPKGESEWLWTLDPAEPEPK
jgi:hypothetical protein